MNHSAPCVLHIRQLGSHASSGCPKFVRFAATLHPQPKLYVYTGAVSTENNMRIEVYLCYLDIIVTLRLHLDHSRLRAERGVGWVD